MKSRKARTILIICGIILIIIILLCSIISVITYSMFPRVRESLILRKNDEAQRIEYIISHQLDTLQLPQNETVILTGEYVRESYDSYLLVYANDWIEEDIFLDGTATRNYHNYWAARISDGKTEETWCGERPITQMQLHEYTHASQKEQVCFVTLFTPLRWLMTSWADDSELIGYYKTMPDTVNEKQW